MTVTVFGYLILISIDFYDFIFLFSPYFYFGLRRYIKHSRQCFIGYPDTSKVVKNTPLRVVFSTLFSVFGYPSETLSTVIDILLEFLFLWKALHCEESHFSTNVRFNDHSSILFRVY